jgi:hypothetical protein
VSTRKIIPVFMALVLVPVALAFAGQTGKTAAASIGIFWLALGIFFFNDIKRYITKNEERDQD